MVTVVRSNGTLTQTGRLMRTVVGVLLLAGALVLGPQAFAGGGTDAASGGVEGAHSNFDTYTVVAGQTLWEIATQVGPSGVDPQLVVKQILELNGLTSSAVAAGQQILLPDFD